MFLGVAAYAEAEIGVAGLQQRDEVAGVAETVFGGREGRLALGRIAAQRHDIAETTGINAIGDLGKFGAGMADAREVRHDGEAKVAFQKVTDLCRAVASRAPGSGGHGYEIGGHAVQRGRGGTEGFNAGVVLGWKEFQRPERTVLREEFGDGTVVRPDISRIGKR